MIPDEIFPDTWKNTIVADVDDGKIGWNARARALSSVETKLNACNDWGPLCSIPNTKGELSSRLLSP
jgi:hypothetical protein